MTQPSSKRIVTEAALGTALNTKVNTSLLGVANGIPTLDSAGKVQTTQLPTGFSGFTPRGTWAASTNYAVNDIIVYNGQTWRVSTAHNSGSTPPSDAGPWTNLELWAAKGSGGSGSATYATLPNLVIPIVRPPGGSFPASLPTGVKSTDILLIIGADPPPSYARTSDVRIVTT